MKVLIFGLVAALLCGCTPSPYKNVPMAAPRSYSEGEEALLRGEYADAERHLGAYIETGRTTYRARALYQLARARYQTEDYSGAMAALKQLENEFPDSRGKQTIALHGDVAYALGDRLDGILRWEAAYSQSTVAERDVLLPRITSAMRSLSNDEANELARLLTVPELYELAVDRLVSPPTAVYHAPDAAVDAGIIISAEADIPIPESAPVVPEIHAITDIEPIEDAVIDRRVTELPVIDANSEEQVDEILGTVTEPPQFESGDIVDKAAPQRIAAVSDTIAAESAVDNSASTTGIDDGQLGDEIDVGPRIACILPLTGAGRQEGDRALKSLRRAVNDGSLIIRDSGSNAAEVRGLIRDLAADKAIIAVLGPLLADTTSAAVSEASRLNLPILPLQSAARGSSTLPEASDAELAEYAIKGLGARRIGIIRSGADHSQFTEAATTLGATIVGTHQLGAGTPDLSSVIESTQSWIDDGGVDAIFIPAPARSAVAIAASARTVAPQVILLGNQEWNDPVALTTAGINIDGAVIAAPSGPTASTSLESQIQSAARALQRAIALGETARTQTKTLLASISSQPTGPTLLRVTGGRTSAIER